MITREIVKQKLEDYIQQTLPFEELVNWAEQAMMDEEFDAVYLDVIRDVVARIGLADVRMFGLTWDDCQEMLTKLGYAARVQIVTK